ncbi:hypothetical protein G6F46_003352 [Rhizopus delemar]|uniref:NodB homology domain-containing protein n=2 Tax=Rhizopus TaxID=4842 RepID=A0A9P7CS34_9FUNG|nr:hypothetical protein G6F55_001433 [Rhizopus delemar]KAG1548641.1 hypothetical protein G6F51_003540 [Rhizopus arrhizus]KAG1527692.1 hypothetical protein G6F52_001315 [Rhizopus delemar]KAG1562192.1 hypothetical protein G6F49_001130 [Rhizopus delemar]KAG1573147.1 hypothetical protein G6F50_003110 [Rhizopus delemar]
MKHLSLLSAITLMPLLVSALSAYDVGEKAWTANALTRITTSVTETIWTDAPYETGRHHHDDDDWFVGGEGEGEGGGEGRGERGGEVVEEEEEVMDGVDDVLDEHMEDVKKPDPTDTKRTTTTVKGHKVTKTKGPTKTAKNKNTKTAWAPIIKTHPSRPPLAQVTACKSEGQIALTYSEGPTDATAKIAQQLSEADARANFFINATWLNIPHYAAIASDVYKAGHLIGMTYRMKNDDPKAISDSELKKDIIENAQAIEKLLGVAPKYVRLHLLDQSNARIEKVMAELGFVTVGYNLDSEDYVEKNATGPGSVQEAYTRAFKDFSEKFGTKGSFVAIHYDVLQSSSVSAVGHIVNTIEQEGYMMVRLDGCLNDPKPYKKSAESTVYVHDQFSYNQPDYHQGQKYVSVDNSLGLEDPREEHNSNTGTVNRKKTALFYGTFVIALIMFFL